MAVTAVVEDDNGRPVVAAAQHARRYWDAVLPTLQMPKPSGNSDAASMSWGRAPWYNLAGVGLPAIASEVGYFLTSGPAVEHRPEGRRTRRKSLRPRTRVSSRDSLGIGSGHVA